jgi:hypothetical protein
MNELRFFDLGDGVIGTVRVGPLAIAADGVIFATAESPSLVPRDARWCELLSNGRCIGSGPLALCSPSET